MLASWSIENFKSFRGWTDIELGPVTIFVGANSSGKSTIIQSLLLLKQTLEYAAPTRALALNGPILKLGTFSAQESPHLSDRPENVGEERLLLQHLGEAPHQRAQPSITHGWQ